MIFGVIFLRVVSIALIILGAIAVAKGQRKFMKYTGFLVILLGLGVMIVPILRVFGGLTIALNIYVVLIVIGLAITLLFKVRNKVGKYAGIAVLLLLVIVGGPAWVVEGLYAPTAEQYNQLEQVIRTHDVFKIKELSVDKATEDLLLGLPKNAKIDATDFQGGGPVGEGFSIGYFPARIGGYDVNTYMITKTGFQFIPHWNLIEISINTIPIRSIKIDSKWFQNNQ